MGDQERLLADRLRALRSRGVPRDEDDVEDRQGDGWQEDGGAALPEVERDGGDQVRAAAAAGGGHVQELRGPVPHRVPGWQRRRHAWQDRQEDGQDRGGQGQEVSSKPDVDVAMDSWQMRCDGEKILMRLACFCFAIESAYTRRDGQMERE